MGTILSQFSRIAMELFWLTWWATTKEHVAMNFTPAQLIIASWFLFGGYWLFAALGTKNPQRRKARANASGTLSSWP